MPKAAKSSPSIADLCKELEGLSQQLESDELPLEDAIARYEEAMSIVSKVQTRLDAAEQKVRMLTEQDTAEENAKQAEA